MHWVIHILIRFRESTQHTNPKSTKYCLFDAKGLPRKYSQSRKTLKFTSRQCTKPNNFVDQLKVWSSTYKAKYNFGLATTQQQAHNRTPEGFTTMQFWSCNHTTAKRPKLPAGFTHIQFWSRNHTTANYDSSKLLQVLHNDNNDHKWPQNDPTWSQISNIPNSH